MLAEAKARVIMYGDASVIDHMARVSRAAATSEARANELFVELVLAMRRAGGAAEPVSGAAVAELLTSASHNVK
jgi:hypothetical protein